MSVIDEKTIKNLAELARLKLTAGEEKKLLKDLEKILAHFEELKEVDVLKVQPMAGGVFGKNVLREDAGGGRLFRERAVGSFPEVSEGFLKVPPVFGE